MSRETPHETAKAEAMMTDKQKAMFGAFGWVANWFTSWLEPSQGTPATESA